MKSTDIMNFSKAAVNKYLRTKPELEVFRDDLVQEASFKLFNVYDEWDPSYGNDRGLWLDYQARFAIQNYVNRKERKHFRKGPVDHDSSYWDIPEPVEIEELPDDKGQDTEEIKRALMEALTGVTLTSREHEFIAHWLDLGQLSLVAEAMDINFQRASALWRQIVIKAQEANEV